LKRAAGVKDSGNFFAGHGGSLFFSFFFFYKKEKEKEI